MNIQTEQTEFVIIPKKKKVSKKKILIIEEDLPPSYIINKEVLAENFMKCVTGYHFINTEPINETVWEAINSQVLELSGCAVLKTSSGSHSSGKDISCGLGGLSNKSSKYSKKGLEFAISSYRLTTVCSDKECGNVESIVQEINSRKNYEYYSFIVRDETEDEITYDWYLIPSDYPTLSPESYTWEPMYGQRGKKTGEQVGWKTNDLNGSKMTITFSMSSQLWLNVAVTEEMRSFIIGNCTVSKKTKLNYLQVYEMFTSPKI
jgi:hypothetical protein